MTEPRHPAVAVDGLVVVDGKLVAVRRGNDPFRGMPALPGGFIELGESTVAAVVREVREETGLETAGDPLRGGVSHPPSGARGPPILIRDVLDPRARTLTQRIHAAATMTKTRDDNNGNVASVPTSGTGRERTPRTAAMAEKRILNEVP